MPRVMQTLGPETSSKPQTGSYKLNKKLLRARSPLRISLAGGGTDVSPYAEEHGGVAINAAIDKYAYVSLEAQDGTQFALHELDDGTKVEGDVDQEVSYDGTLDLAKAVIQRLQIQQGFNLWMHSDAPWGSGLGSSSTHIVTVLGVFSYWMHLGLGSYEIAELAYQRERSDLQQRGGRQDQYAATFGGFNFMEFSDRGTVMNPLRINADVLNELHYRSLLCFVGRTRRSSEILEDQVTRYKTGNSSSVSALHQTKDLTHEMKRALLRGQIDHMGMLLDEAWDLKKNYSDLISTPRIDEIYEHAIKHGALGGKLLGAGGGGHMFFLCPKKGKHEVAHQLTKLGVDTVPFSFEAQGLTTWESMNGWQG